MVRCSVYYTMFRRFLVWFPHLLPPMILKLRYLTLVLDYLLLLGAFSLAYFVRVDFIFSTDLPFSAFFQVSMIAAALWLAALLVFRGYNPSIRFTRTIHLMKVVVAGVTGTAAFGLIYYFVQKAFFSRLLLVYIFIFGTGVMLLFHLGMQQLEKHLIRKGYGNIPVLLIGSNRAVKGFIHRLKKNTSPYVPVAILDGYGTSLKEIAGVPVLGKLNILEETVDKYDIQAVVQGDNIEQVVNIHHFCQKHRLNYFLLPYLFGTYQGDLQISVLERPVINPLPRTKTFWESLLS